ncbi:neuropeptide SIFamide receptor [Ixodes scapularis]
MKRQITIRVCRVIIAVIWSFSLTITLPWTFFFRLMPMLSESNSSLQVCREDWPTERMGMLYFIVANLILCYLLPLCVITLCYIFIWLKVWRRRPPGEAHDFGVENMIQRSKVKVAKMLLVVVIVFAISWLPLYAIFARLKIGEPLVDGSAEQAVIEVAAPVAQWLDREPKKLCLQPISSLEVYTPRGSASFAPPRTNTQTHEDPSRQDASRPRQVPMVTLIICQSSQQTNPLIHQDLLVVRKKRRDVEPIAGSLCCRDEANSLTPTLPRERHPIDRLMDEEDLVSH